jgi:hypothetical protein
MGKRIQLSWTLSIDDLPDMRKHRKNRAFQLFKWQFLHVHDSLDIRKCQWLMRNLGKYGILGHCEWTI